MKPLSQAKRHALSVAKAKERIMQIIGMSDFEYNKYQFEMAFKYAVVTGIEDNTDCMKRLSTSGFFWAWWRNQYFITDELFINEMNHSTELYSRSRNELLRVYLHSQVYRKAHLDRYQLEIILKSPYKIENNKVRLR